MDQVLPILFLLAVLVVDYLLYQYLTLKTNVEQPVEIVIKGTLESLR